MKAIVLSFNDRGYAVVAAKHPRYGAWSYLAKYDSQISLKRLGLVDIEQFGPDESQQRIMRTFDDDLNEIRIIATTVAKANRETYSDLVHGAKRASPHLKKIVDQIVEVYGEPDLPRFLRKKS